MKKKNCRNQNQEQERFKLNRRRKEEINSKQNRTDEETIQSRIEEETEGFRTESRNTMLNGGRMKHRKKEDAETREVSLLIPC